MKGCQKNPRKLGSIWRSHYTSRRSCGKATTSYAHGCVTTTISEISVLVRRNSDFEEGHPFANRIMKESIPPHFIVPKVPPFIGEGDPKVHLKAFRAHMLISGGNDVIRCKMFVGTLTGTALKWFSKIPTASITSFYTFSKIFLEQFATNRPKQLQLVYMFDVKQHLEETLK